MMVTRKEESRFQRIYSGRTEAGLVTPGVLAWVAFVGSHVVLALLMYQSTVVATLHALATLGVGLWISALGRRPEHVVYIGAYIVAAEVLWRMSSAGVFWEFDKYAMVLVFLLGFIRFRGFRLPLAPIAFFALLIPSTILTLFGMDFSRARDSISFYLSGPLALTMAACFFAGFRLTLPGLGRALLVFLGPVAGVATLSLASVLRASQINFSTTRSNFVTSGGFGPNQVTNILGLAVVIACMCLAFGAVPKSLRPFLYGILVVCGTLSALTFSRSGLYNAGVAVVVLVLFLAPDAHSLSRLLVLFTLVGVLAAFFILPLLDSFTQGRIVGRFTNTDLSGRDLIAIADLQIWVDNPVFGVGPGQADDLRDLDGRRDAAHTEFTRLLAEHGLFGLGALLLLGVMAFSNLRLAGSARSRAFVATCVVWTWMFMLNSAMRMAAPAFFFGLSFASITTEEESESAG